MAEGGRGQQLRFGDTYTLRRWDGAACFTGNMVRSTAQVPREVLRWSEVL